MLGTVRRKAGINVLGNLMVPAVLGLVCMLATVRRKTGINVQGNLMVPAVSQHAWNGEKESRN